MVCFSPENQDQVLKFLRFFRLKKDVSLKSIQREIQEIIQEKVQDEVYSKEDLLEILDFISSAVYTEASGKISSIVNMSCLSVIQLLEMAETKGISLEIETSNLEDQAMLESIEQLSFDSLPKNVKKAGLLTSFKDEAKAFREEANRNEEARARLENEINSLRDKLVLLEDEHRSLAESKEDSDRLLSEAKEENERKLSSSSQFLTMKKIMKNQANTIRDLREKLAKYEPDD